MPLLHCSTLVQFPAMPVTPVLLVTCVSFCADFRGDYESKAKESNEGSSQRYRDVNSIFYCFISPQDGSQDLSLTQSLLCGFYCRTVSSLGAISYKPQREACEEQPPLTFYVLAPLFLYCNHAVLSTLLSYATAMQMEGFIQDPIKHFGFVFSASKSVISLALTNYCLMFSYYLLQVNISNSY